MLFPVQGAAWAMARMDEEIALQLGQPPQGIPHGSGVAAGQVCPAAGAGEKGVAAEEELAALQRHAARLKNFFADALDQLQHVFCGRAADIDDKARVLFAHLRAADRVALEPGLIVRGRNVVSVRILRAPGYPVLSQAELERVELAVRYR